MRQISASNLAIDGSELSLQIDGDSIVADLKDWPSLWELLATAGPSKAILLNDVIGFPDQDITIDVEEVLILAKIGEVVCDRFHPDWIDFLRRIA